MAARQQWAGLLTLLGALVPCPAAAATIQEQIGAARAQAERCALDQAIAAGELALQQARREWPSGHEGFFIIHQDLAAWLNDRLDYGAAEAHARSALAIAREKRGENEPLYGLAAQNLGVALAGRQQFSEAEPLLKKAEVIFAARADAANRLNALLALSGLEFARGRSARGLEVAEQAAALLPMVASSNPSLMASAALRISDARRRMLRFSEADSALSRAEASLKASPASHGAKRLLLAKASLEFEKGNLRGALAFLADAERQINDPCDPTVEADLPYRRGTIHLIGREVAEARMAFGEAVSQVEALGLQDSPRYAEALVGLAMTAGLAGEFDDSSKLFDRAIAALRKSFGGISSAEAQTALEQAYMLTAADRPSEAIPIARRAREMLSGNIDQQPLDQAYAAATLGRALKDASRFNEAEPLLKEALKAFASVRGNRSFDLAPGLIALGEIKLAQRKLGEAEDFLREALAIQEQGGWSGAQGIGIVHSRLAAVLDAAGSRAAALRESERGVDVLEDRLVLGEQRPWADAEGERRRARDIVELDLRLSFSRLATGGDTPGAAITGRMLRAGQLGASIRTGEAIAQMAERVALRGDRLGLLVRERQDLIVRLRSLQQEQFAALTDRASRQPHGTESLTEARTIASRLQAIDGEIDRNDRRASLLLKSPVASLREVKANLRPDEALLAFFVSSDATYVVAITGDGEIAYKANLSRGELETAVTTLRSALDPTQFASDLPPPYPFGLAHRLYAELIAPAGTLLAGKRKLIVVPDGPLMSMPFGVLLSAPMAESRQGEDSWKAAPWLVKSYVIEVAPSVASFTALRQIRAKPANGNRFLGIGAPDLPATQVSNVRAVGSAPIGVSRQWREMLRGLEPLPESAAELRTIARRMGEDRSTLMLGKGADEQSVRKASLDRFSIVAFATHAMIAGDLEGYDEPALVLTPPLMPSRENDGLLTASEVASLKLDADWVILSACSTAAGDGRLQAEPFTGLAKAFFYAGARSLLVTNWPVDSVASASISTKALASFQAGVGRPESLRAAQLEIIGDRDGSGRTHPVFWGSFVVVGAD